MQGNVRVQAWLSALAVIATLFSTSVAKPEPLDRSAMQNPPSGWGNWCGLEITAETRNRQVFGSDIAAECGDCSGHTAPYGNWGVDSFFGSRVDGRQYEGWQRENPSCSETMDDLEWNSCTRDYSQSEHYSDSPPLQTSQTDAQLGTVWDWHSTTEEDGCAILDGWQLSGGTVLEIWELDWWWGSDDHVTDLPVTAPAVSLSCGVDGCTPVASDWGGGSNDITAADFRVRVVSSCSYVDGKGCR